jgi:KipI family sensor histidine kinase inhibitor
MSSGLFEKLRFRLSGDRALLVECGEGIDLSVNRRVLELTSQLKKNPPQGVLAVVPAYCSCTVIYDPLLTDPELLQKKIGAVAEAPESAASLESVVVSIPVCYGDEFGPDMDFVSARTGLRPDEIATIHCASEYPIYMVGFTPGFCYLGGMDERLRTPRRKTPRLSIPAGAVGIAETQTGVYPVESPGGWQIIGKTPLRLFAPERANPFLYKAGDRIRFVRISRNEFDLLSTEERSR